MSAAPIRAQAVLYSGRGGYEVISVGERLVRPPEAGEIRIRVHAAAVNPTDVLLRDPGLGDLAAPMTPGMDVAGVVEAVGEGVIRLAPGDEIMAAVSPMRPEGGAQAAYLVAPAGWATPKPKGLSLVQAATLPMNGLTALYALDLAGLSPGQSLAVSGGAGWLAYQTIVIAKQRGLRVLADAKPDEIDRVRAYGADVVVERGPDVDAVVPDGATARSNAAFRSGPCWSIRCWIARTGWTRLANWSRPATSRRWSLPSSSRPMWRRRRSCCPPAAFAGGLSSSSESDASRGQG
jgi:NADPH2:quinone reductase